MIRRFPQNTLRFIVLIFLQIVILDNIQFSGYINQYIYVLFILLLPFETPGWILLIIGFATGFTIDIFSHTLGMHTSATVFMAFLRPYVLALISPKDGYETGTFPRVHYYGFEWFLKYSLILIFSHHLFLFFIEMFRFSDFFFTLGRTFISTLFSVFFVVLSQYFIFRK